MALETSPESPAPVRSISALIADWIGRLGMVWIEGQITQISRRPGMRTAWVTLRDVEVDMSLSIVVDVAVLDQVTPPVTDGQRVIVFAKPEFYSARGQLQLRAREFRPVGRGALLEELERLRALFAAEGLFAPERKRALPFAPQRIGLVCGRASAAMHDVLVNARKRWPRADFEVREVAVQGASAVTEVVGALTDLQRMPGIEVIVIARGGGSVEDLLPFSNERLVRAVAGCQVPVVSAIGHEQDVPLVDLVADVRASTPTDAAKVIVPDLARERALIGEARRRTRISLIRRLETERQQVLVAVNRGRSAMRHRVQRERTHLDHLLAQVRSLSPLATLERGYAVVQSVDTGRLIRDAHEVRIGERMRIRVAIGHLVATRTPPTSDEGE